MTIDICPIGPETAPKVADLYRHVSTIAGPGALARRPDEVETTYFETVLIKAASGGVAFGAWSGENLVGELHAVPMGPQLFRHVWTDLTVLVHPSMQGVGVGRSLFHALFAAARGRTPRVDRIELFAASRNTGAIKLYESLGFVREGRFVNRLHYGGGVFDDDIPMAISLAGK